MTDLQKQAAEVVGRHVAGLSVAGKRALLRTEGAALRQTQSDRGILAGPLTDYSFRPARLTPLGLACRQLLQDNPHARDNEEMGR